LEDIIKKEMERKNINAKEFAKLLSVTPGNISKFMNKKAEINFVTFLNMIQVLSPEKEFELMQKYVLSCTKPQNVKLSMEYLSRHSLSDLLEKLIDKALTMKNALTAEMAELYKFLNEMSNEGFPKSFVKKYFQMQPRDDNSKLLLHLIFSYYLLERAQYNTLFELIEEIDERVETMTDEYLKDSFKTRIFEIYSDAFLTLDEREKTRCFAQEILNYPYAGGKVLAKAYHNIGFSYLFESQEKTLYYLNKSVQTYKEHGYIETANWILNTRLLPTENYFSLISEEQFTKKPNEYPMEYAHFLIVKKRYNEALKILEGVPDNPYKDYIKGLCFPDEKGIVLLYKSMLSFERVGNKFSSNLARNELKRRGYVL